jgi:hypothetical protein
MNTNDTNDTALDTMTRYNAEADRILAKANANPTRHNWVRCRVVATDAAEACRAAGRTVAARTYRYIAMTAAHNGLTANR